MLVRHTNGVHMKKFYDRKEELAALASLKDGTNLAVIYGRRRIGKTRLVLEHLKGLSYRYVFIPRYLSLHRFLKDLADEHDIPEFVSLKDALSHLFKTSENVFIDEFQNLKYLDASIFSNMQRMIDEMDFSGHNVNIFVADSSHSMMRDIFMEHSHPLYGRARIAMNIRPLPLKAVTDILADFGVNDFAKQIEFYAVFGGVPRYYEYLRGTDNFNEEMRRLFFTEAAPLREEGKIVLLSEFGGEFSTYLSVLDAVAHGRRALGDIAAELNQSSPTVNKYLSTLRKEYSLVRRLVPATERPDKSRRGQYVVDDNFLSFWLRFVKRYENYYEQGLDDMVYEFFRRDINSFVSRTFEEIARQTIKSNEEYERVGSWWNRRGDEIDIIALNEGRKEILFGEVKWKSRPVGWNVVEDLMKKRELVNWHKEDRRERFLMVSKSGFTKSCLERMDGEGVMHWDLEDISALLKRYMR